MRAAAWRLGERVGSTNREPWITARLLPSERGPLTDCCKGRPRLEHSLAPALIDPAAVGICSVRLCSLLSGSAKSLPLNTDAVIA